MDKQNFYAIIKPYRQDFITNPNEEEEKIMQDHFYYLQELLNQNKLFFARKSLHLNRNDILMAVLTAYAGERGIAQKMEVAVGVAFALSMSIAVFLMYYLPPAMIPQIWGYLFGDLLLLDNLDIVLLAGTALSLILIVILFKKEFVYVSIDMEGSTAHGMSARGYHYLMIIERKSRQGNPLR